MRKLIYVALLKICGVTRRVDAELVDRYADYAGFIIDQLVDSPRRVDPREAADMASTLSRAKPVAVFAKAPPREAIELAARHDFPIVQHHGEFSEADAEFAESRGIAIAPVSTYKPGTDPSQVADQVSRLLALRGIEYVLVDADKGSRETYEAGLRVPLRVYEAVAGLGRVALAGGVTPSSARLLMRLRPYMIDVASGVESSPGVKDPALVEELARVVKGGGL